MCYGMYQYDFHWTDRRYIEVFTVYAYQHAKTEPKLDKGGDPPFFNLCITEYAR